MHAQLAGTKLSTRETGYEATEGEREAGCREEGKDCQVGEVTWTCGRTK